MSNNELDRVLFVPLARAAVTLGIPLAFLRREVEAKRMPAVRAGRSWLVSMPRVREVLATRAEGQAVAAALAAQQQPPPTSPGDTEAVAAALAATPAKAVSRDE